MTEPERPIICCICGGPAAYVEQTQARGPYGMGWQLCPIAYPDRGYCIVHYFLGQERRQEYEHRAISALYNIYPRPDAGEGAGE